jgi:hypothetical protein
MVRFASSETVNSFSWLFRFSNAIVYEYSPGCRQGKVIDAMFL